MTHKEFLVLSTIATAPAPLTQRAVAAQTGMSVGSVNEAVSNLTEQGLVTDRHITDEGLDALEPYRVKRAVLIAAGFGSRMVPITLNTPIDCRARPQAPGRWLLRPRRPSPTGLGGPLRLTCPAATRPNEGHRPPRAARRQRVP